MQPFSIAVEEPARQSQQSQDQRVQPDQRIEYEIRPQPAEPTVFQPMDLVRTWARRNNCHGLHNALFGVVARRLIYR